MIAAGVCLLAGLWSVIPGPRPAADPRRPTAAATATATAPATATPLRPLLARASEGSAPSVGLLAPDDLDADDREVDPDDLGLEPEVDSSEYQTSVERIADARDLFEQSLRAHTAGLGAPEERDALRLQAASALTTLRSELGATPDGRREVLAYAARLHATAGR